MSSSLKTLSLLLHSCSPGLTEVGERPALGLTHQEVIFPVCLDTIKKCWLLRDRTDLTQELRQGSFLSLIESLYPLTCLSGHVLISLGVILDINQLKDSSEHLLCTRH